MIIGEGTSRRTHAAPIRPSSGPRAGDPVRAGRKAPLQAATGATRKLRVYHTLYRLNLSFASIVAHCRALRKSGILGPKDTRLYQSYAQELQADINARLASILEMVESDDHARFGKVTHAWEKEITDPDDVFLHAEERRRELARQGKKPPGPRPVSGKKPQRKQPSRSRRKP